MVHDAYRKSVADDYITDNRRTVASDVKSDVVRCHWCGGLFVRRHPNERYCSKKCRDNARLEQSRDKAISWYHRHKGELSEESRYGLGSGFLGSHRRLDFVDEQKVIEREFVRLRLSRK